MDEPPVDGKDPNIRLLLNRLIEDTATYARAEATFFKAELGARGRHLVPAAILFLAAVIAGFALIIAAVVVATIWLGLAIGFGWAILGLILLLSCVIGILLHLARAHYQKAIRPWTRP